MSVHMNGCFDDRAEFLARLGVRVRALRRASGLTVAEFAQRASLSPRFINQLEAGRGNISIVNLGTAAQALNRTLYELIPPDARDQSLRAQVWSSLSDSSNDELHELQQWMLQRLKQRNSPRPAARFIALLGVRLAGKSTIGRQLAKKLKMDFVELSRFIEGAADMPVGEIFTTHGETYYQRLEHEELDKLFATSQGCVLELGGSVVTSGENWELVKQRCFTVWLQATPADLWERRREVQDMRSTKGRTFAMTALKALLKRRDPLYAESRLVVKTNGKPAEAVAQILKALGDSPGA
jgi:XRE family aerobic/anaerobic benzoate catabolism transcriptional regulator